MSLAEVFGRDAELGALHRFVVAVPEGPCALVLEGEPGIGKTTLWRAGLEFAEERSHRILVCRCTESEAKLSYAALADLLANVEEEALEGLPEPQRHALEVALLRKDPGDVPADQRTVSAGALGVLRFLATSGPIVLALDDPQWMDAASRLAFGFAMHRLSDEPIGILAAVRAGEEPEDPLGLQRTIRSERLQRVTVGPLSEEALDRLVRERVGEEVPGPVLLQLHAVTGGNALFALEIARSTLEAGAGVSGQPLRVPRSLREQVRERLAALSSKTRLVLLTTASLSRPTIEVVERATAADGEAVSAAVEAGVLEIAGDAVRFTHPLYASVAYADARSDDRSRTHRRLAELVADPEEKARHLALSSSAPDPAVAGSLDGAAAHARSRGAPVVAAELCLAARRFTPEERHEDRRRRTIAAADHLYEAGDMSRAERLLEGVLADCSPGPERAQVLWRLARFRLYDGAEALLRQALSEAGDDPRLCAGIHRYSFWVSLGHYRYADSAEHARAALEFAERAGDAAGLASSLALSAAGEFFVGHGLALDVIERALELWAAEGVRGSGDPAIAADDHPGLIVGAMLPYADGLAEARSALEALRNAAIERGADPSFPYVSVLLARVELRAGNWDLALRLMEEVCRLKQPAELGLFWRGTVYAHLGRVAAAREDLEEAIRQAREGGWLEACVWGWHALGLLELSLGDPAEAHRHLARATELFWRSGIEEPGLAPFFPDEIEALVALGELDEAERLTDWLQERGRALDRAWAIAVGSRCHGLLLAARGDLPGALASLERAVEEHESVPVPFDLGRTLLVLGTVRRRAKQKRAAREALEQALAVFEQLGSKLWAEKARAELGAIGGRAPGIGQLTPTEERVARLAAAGRTNREIAETLFLSVRTVEGHLSHAYQKLGVRSRTELALVLDAANA